MTYRQYCTRGLTTAVIAVLCLSSLAAVAAPRHDAEHDGRMGWWREARFGMFIHWGPDAMPSLHWNGKPWNSGSFIWYPAHESILHIPPDEWQDKVIKQFNPVDYDADAWVKLAKRAGMKYMVIVTKHHNGFCMWPGLEAYDIRSTPFNRHPIGQLVAACQKHGMRIVFYFSQLDWHDPDAVGDHKPKTYPEGWIVNPDAFLPRMRGQVRDLLSRYGPIDVLWFDGEWIEDWTAEMGRALEEEIRRIQPDIVINDRVGKRAPGDGDFSTPEQFIPPNGLPGVDWETCMTINDTWFYVKQDQNWKSATTLIRNLIDVASKGGNYLLNVGPDPRGFIPPESVKRLEAIGDWLAVNGESIHGSAANPFAAGVPWGRVTRKDAGPVTRLYLHVFDWPESGEVLVPPVGNRIRGIRTLAGGDAIQFSVQHDGILVRLPGEPAHEAATVLVMEIEGHPAQ